MSCPVRAAPTPQHCPHTRRAAPADRVGGRTNFFHCRTCNCCYAVTLRDSHVCIEVRSRPWRQRRPACSPSITRLCAYAATASPGLKHSSNTAPAGLWLHPRALSVAACSMRGTPAGKHAGRASAAGAAASLGNPRRASGPCPSHPQNSMHANCPVCCEFLFDSIRPINIMPCGAAEAAACSCPGGRPSPACPQCQAVSAAPASRHSCLPQLARPAAPAGHTIHQECLRSLSDHATYTCPV
jgi:hypothetical protein